VATTPAISDLVSSHEAATIAGCTRVHICRLCKAESLEATRIGRDWLVSRSAALELKGRLTNRCLAKRAKKSSSASSPKRRK
jgi:hypothetical protein